MSPINSFVVAVVFSLASYSALLFLPNHCPPVMGESCAPTPPANKASTVYCRIYVWSGMHSKFMTFLNRLLAFALAGLLCVFCVWAGCIGQWFWGGFGVAWVLGGLSNFCYAVTYPGQFSTQNLSLVPSLSSLLTGTYY